MRIAVVGLGAVGGLIAARLIRAGHPVCALARGATLDAVRRHGLRFADERASGPVTVETLELLASDRAEHLGPVDLVVLSVKAPALPAVAPQVAKLLGRDTAILSAMNGVPWWMFHGLDPALARRTWVSIDPDRELARLMPPQRVIGSVLHLASACPEPGLVRHSTGQRLILGEPAGGQSERSLAAAAILRNAGFDVEEAPRIQQELWFKLWGNMTVNPISAFTGATVDRIVGDALVRGFMSRVMIEAAEIGSRIGLPITMSPDDRHQVTRRIGAFRTSMLQDVDARRPIELDSLVGAVREIGEAVGVATPFTDALMGLTRVFARECGLYPNESSERMP
jgi:2-dehydropantoate 2-reductase